MQRLLPLALALAVSTGCVGTTRGVVITIGIGAPMAIAGATIADDKPFGAFVGSVLGVAFGQFIALILELEDEDTPHD